MGLFRKITSVSTGGIVDFRSDKERSAMYGRQSRNELRKQTRIMQQAARDQVPVPTAQPPAPVRRNVIGPDAPLEDRVRSTDPAVKAAAIAEWKAGRHSS